jgi:hypothetical protein
MRRLSSTKGALTSKRFRRFAAFLIVLALWATVLGTLVLTLSRASAERGLVFRTEDHQAGSATKGDATAYAKLPGGDIKQTNALEFAKKMRHHCVGQPQNCNLDPASDRETSEAGGSGISYSTGTTPQFGGGYKGNKVLDFSSGYGSGAFGGAFAGFGSSYTGSGFGNSSLMAEATSLTDRTDVLVDSLSRDPYLSDLSAVAPSIRGKAASPDPIEPLFVAQSDPIIDPNDQSQDNPPKEVPPTYTEPTNPLPVPEPLTLSLFAAGLICIFTTRKLKLPKADAQRGSTCS